MASARDGQEGYPGASGNATRTPSSSSRRAQAQPHRAGHRGLPDRGGGRRGDHRIEADGGHPQGCPSRLNERRRHGPVDERAVELRTGETNPGAPSNQNALRGDEAQAAWERGRARPARTRKHRHSGLERQPAAGDTGSSMGNTFFEQPTINSPYEYPVRPVRHWELDEEGQPTNRMLDRRWRVELITPIPKPQGREKAASQTEFGLGDSSDTQSHDPTPIINELRDHIDRWHVLPSPKDWRVTSTESRRSHELGWKALGKSRTIQEQERVGERQSRVRVTEGYDR